MDISITYAFLPHTDGEAALSFYRDLLGFELRKDVGYEDMRWLTVGPAGQPETSTGCLHALTRPMQTSFSSPPTRTTEFVTAQSAIPPETSSASTRRSDHQPRNTKIDQS